MRFCAPARLAARHRHRRTAFPGAQPSSAFPASSSLAITPSRSPQKAPPWVWIGLSVAAFLLICVCLAGWVGYAAWMRGRGGEIAFRQHNQMGNQAFRAHDYSRAAEEYSQMIALRPRRVDGYLLRGMADDAGGRYRDAITDDTKALSLPGVGMSASDLYSNRASAEAQIGQFPAAIGDYTQALLLYQRTQGADSGTEIFGYLRSDYQERAAAYAAIHQNARAEADYDTVIRSYAPGPTDFARRGEAREAQGRNSAALADYEQVIRLAPDDPDSYGEESQFSGPNASGDGGAGGLAAGAACVARRWPRQWPLVGNSRLVPIPIGRAATGDHQ